MKVTIYTKAECIPCNATKQLFNRFPCFELDIIDITENEELQEKVRQMGYRSMPVVIVDDAVKSKWCGFRPDFILQTAESIHSVR